MSKGIEFEKKTLIYLRSLFEELGLRVLEARQQGSGTQNGFDIRIRFLDDNGKERKFYFECKDYTTSISWNDIAVKILELHASSHQPDGYIAISPHVDFSNINVNVLDGLANTVQSSIQYWTPEAKVEEYFSVDKIFFKQVYGKRPSANGTDRAHTLDTIRSIIVAMLQEKDAMAAKKSGSILTKELTLKIAKVHPDDIIGRAEDLEELHGLLFNNKRVVVVNGLGGIGKTTLAQAYLSKYYKTYQHIVWITQLSDNIANDINNATALAENLGVSREGKDVTQLCYEILNGLKGVPDGPNLLVLDNADEQLRNLKDYLPSQPDWHVLVTSRKRVEGFHPKVLDFLSPEQSIALFKKHCTLIKVDAMIAELVKTVDYHTLTIEILAKTAQLRRTGIEDLKKAIQDDLVSNVHVDHKGEKIDKVLSYLSSIFILSELSSEEAWLMKQFCCLPTEFHTYELLQELTDPDGDKSESFAEILNGLVEQGWLMCNKESDAYKMHVIVKEVAVRQLQPTLENIEGLMDTITENLRMDYAKDNPVDKFPWIPFGQALLGNLLDDNSVKIGILQNNLGMRLKDLGDYVGARSLLEKALNSAEDNYGPDHPTTANSYSNLGLVLQDLGEYTSARDLLEKAAQSDEHNLGSDHPTTAIKYSNLAIVLQTLGEYTNARALLEKAVSSDEHNYGLNHSNTMTKYSNLAMVLIDLGDYADARVLLEKVVNSDERNYGPDHPNTALSYSNLAQVLQNLGDYAGARTLFEKVVNSDERNFGLEHPSTSRSYSNLGQVLQDLGDYVSARALLEKAMHSDERNFGLDHPIIVKRYSNLALVLKDLGNYTDAQGLLEKAVNSAERNFGLNHLNTAVCYFNLAFVLIELGDFLGALELSAKSLAIFKKTLPEGHPHIQYVQSIYDAIMT